MNIKIGLDYLIMNSIHIKAVNATKTCAHACEHDLIFLAKCTLSMLQYHIIENRRTFRIGIYCHI